MDKECGVMDHTAGGVGSVLVCTVSSWLGLCSGCTITFYDPDIFQPDCLKGLGSVPEMVTVWFAEMNNCEEDAWKGKRCWIILLPVQRM